MPPARPLALAPALALLALVLAPRGSVALDLASRCLSSFAPGTCPCSRRQTPALDFCLTAAGPATCRQRACADHYVCDCAGDVVCRAAPLRTTLACRAPVLADGTCACRRSPIRPASEHIQLIPLRRNAPLAPLRALLRAPLCSEPPPFWGTPHGLRLLRRHWHVVAASHRDSPVRADLPLVRFGHAAHAVSFTSPDALSRAMPAVYPIRAGVPGDLIDPHHTAGLNRMTVECVAASVSIRLAAAGIATRPHLVADPFDVESRLVLRPCTYLSKSNPAVGMSIASLMQRAMLATGDHPLDDASLSHDDVSDACRAINRNFEACQVDLGCVAVST